MRKMFTKLFGLMLLMYLASAFTVANAQCNVVDPDAGNINLVTDLATVCDSAYVLYEVVGYPGAQFAFNLDNDPAGFGGFSTDSTIAVREGVGFRVVVRVNDTCYSEEYHYTPTGSDLITPVEIQEPGVEHPKCAGDLGGEITINFTGQHPPYTYYMVPAVNWGGLPVDNDVYSAYIVPGKHIAVDPGTYYVAVQEANGCVDLTDVASWDTAVVNGPPAELVVDTIYGVDPDCYNGNGIVTVVVSGGTPDTDGNYEVSLNGLFTQTTENDTAVFTVPAGDYTATVTDSFMCSTVSDSTVTLVNPEELKFKIAITDVSCSDGDNGAITVIITSPDTGLYSVSLGDGVWVVDNLTGDASAGDDTITIGNLTADEYYSIYVRNEKTSCDSVGYINPNQTGNVISVQQPGDLVFNLSDTVIDLTCNGDLATVTVSGFGGGSGDYQVMLDSIGGSTVKDWVYASGATVITWNDIVAGKYVVVVRDTNDISCETTNEELVVRQPEAVEIVEGKVEVISPVCYGEDNGTIKIVATGGNGTYKYSIDGKNYKDNNIFAVPAGARYIYAIDPDCPDLVDSMYVNVQELTKNVLVLSSETDTVNDCYDVNENEIVVRELSWASQVGEDRDVTVYITNDMDSIYVSGDEMDMVMDWMAWQMTYRAYDVDPGTYYIWAVDNLGCVFDADQDGEADYITVNVIEPDPLTVTSEVTQDATCYGDYDGVITVKLAGGNDEWYGYAHASSKAQALALDDNAFIELSEGVDSVEIQVNGSVEGTIYYVVVMDECGQRAVSEVDTVFGYDKVTIVDTAMSVVHTACYGDMDGEIEIFPAKGGIGPLSYTLQKADNSKSATDMPYTWLNVTGYENVYPTVFTGLGAGMYRVVVTDEGGCEGTMTGIIEIEGNDEVVITSFTYSDITCFGASDGKINITAAGGAGAPYQFKVGASNWRNFPEGSNSKTIVVIEKGEQIVWIRDKELCESEPDTAWIDEPDEIGLTVVPTASNNCEDSNGKLNITVTGGRPGVNYSIMVNDSLYTWVVKTDTTYISTGLAGGDYTVTAKEDDENGCEVSVTETVDPPVNITYSAVILDSVHCKGGDDGKIVISGISGGLAPYTTSISGPVAGTKTTLNGVITFSNLIAGVYEVTVKDANNCPVVKSLEITEPDTITLEATWIADITCETKGKFSIQAEGGSGQFIYFAAVSQVPEHILVPDPMTSDAWQPDSIFEVLQEGTYIVWAYDTVYGCLVGGEEDVNENPRNEWRVKIEPPTTDVDFDATPTPVMCYGDSTGVIAISGITIDGVAKNETDVNIYIDGALATSGTINGLKAGEYEIEVKDKITGCSEEQTIVIDGPDALLKVKLDKGTGEFTCPEITNGYLEADAEGGVGEYSYTLYQEVDGVMDSLNTYDENSFLVTVGYRYVVVVTDKNGCTATDTMTLNPVAAVEIVEIRDISCADDTLRGSALITITGEPLRTFDIHWRQFENGGIPADEGVMEDVMAGDVALYQKFLYDNENTEDIHYEIWVVDNMGCESLKDTLTIDHKVTSELAATVTVGDVVDCSTEVMVSANGGVAPYMVVVNNMDTVEFTSTTTLMLGGGVQTIDVYDAHLCWKQFVETLDYAYSMDTTFYVYPGDSANLVYAPANIDTMLAKGTYPLHYELEEGCIAEIVVKVIESNGPMNTWRDPLGRTGDNHPIFTLVFKEDVKLSDIGGTLKVMPLSYPDSVVLEIQLTEDMFRGDTVIIDYIATEDSWLDFSTKYLVHVDSAAIVGAEDNFPWGGIQNNIWVFTTGKDPVTDVDDINLNATSYVVYPNPFNDEINITNIDKLTRVIVTNIAGQRVLDVEYPEERIRTTNLVSGVYFVSMFTDSGLAKTDKIVKR